MQPTINQLYKSGQFRLDVSERVLIRDGRVAPLSPKVFDTLLVLIENRGRILGKAELMQTIWPDVFVEESNLTHNISQIRRALGDSEHIETIPRRGYRFVSEAQIFRREAQVAETVETGDRRVAMSLYRQTGASLFITRSPSTAAQNQRWPVLWLRPRPA
jgi:DNA-binding winged helix-turn-helix (wHTH) protein